MKKNLLYGLALLLFLFVLPTKMEAATFKDVSSSKYFYNAVEWGYKEGIISGDGRGNFNPSQKVTQGQFLKMYSEFYKFNITYDKSLPLFQDYYSSLEEYNINFYYGEANNPILRGEIAALIKLAQGEYKTEHRSYVMWDIEKDANELITYMFNNKLSSGVTTANVSLKEKYGFYRELTRGEAIQFFYNLYHLKFNQLKIKNNKPELFTEHDAIVRTYKAHNDVDYYVLSENDANYRSVFVYNGYVIGGYESVIGSNFKGIPIGQSLPGKTFENIYSIVKDDAITAIPLIDKHKTNYVHAVLWQTVSKNFTDKMSFAIHNDLENQSFLNLVYTDLINEFRAKHMKEPLIQHDVLSKAAYLHSEDMALNNFFDHYNLNGESPSDRVAKLDPNFTAGENISAGHQSIFTAHLAWINSLGHRNNMLGNYTLVGFGSYDVPGGTVNNYSKYFTVNLSIQLEDF